MIVSDFLNHGATHGVVKLLNVKLSTNGVVLHKYLPFRARARRSVCALFKYWLETWPSMIWWQQFMRRKVALSTWARHSGRTSLNHNQPISGRWATVVTCSPRTHSHPPFPLVHGSKVLYCLFWYINSLLLSNLQAAFPNNCCVVSTFWFLLFTLHFTHRDGHQ